MKFYFDKDKDELKFNGYNKEDSLRIYENWSPSLHHKFVPFEYQTVQEPVDCLYPLYICKTFISDLQGCLGCLRIPEEVDKAVKNKDCKILLFNTREGWHLDWLDKVAIHLGYPVDSFVYCSGNMVPVSELGVPNYYFNIWETHFYGDYDAQKELIFSDTLRENKFISLNRRPSAQRLSLASELYKYKDEGILSIGTGDHWNKAAQFLPTFNDLKKFYPKQFRKFMRSGIPVPLEYDLDLSSNNPVIDNDTDKFLSSYLFIVSEPFFEDTKIAGVFFSEKTIKPMMFMQPFILFGKCGNLAELRTLGYKTFHPFIDESYDSIVNNAERLEVTIQTCIDFISKPKEELHKMLQDMFPVLEHNYNLLLQRSKMRTIC